MRACLFLRNHFLDWFFLKGHQQENHHFGGVLFLLPAWFVEDALMSQLVLAQEQRSKS